MKNVKTIIGSMMIAVLLGGIMAFHIHKNGLQTTLIAYGIAIVIVAFVFLAAWLIASDQ